MFMTIKGGQDSGVELEGSRGGGGFVLREVFILLSLVVCVCRILAGLFYL